MLLHRPLFYLTQEGADRKFLLKLLQEEKENKEGTSVDKSKLPSHNRLKDITPYVTEAEVNAADELAQHVEKEYTSNGSLSEGKINLYENSNQNLPEPEPVQATVEEDSPKCKSPIESEQQEVPVAQPDDHEMIEVKTEK